METGKGGNPATTLVLTNAMVADSLAEVAVPASVVICGSRIIGSGGAREAASSGAPLLDLGGRYVPPRLVNDRAGFVLRQAIDEEEL